MKALPDRLARIFYVIGGLLFLLLLIGVTAASPWLSAPALALLPFAGWLALLIAVVRLARARAAWLEGQWRWLFIAFLLAMLGVLAAFGFLLRTDPAFDFEAVFRGAETWLKTGSLGEYADYFYYFPNNLGAALLLREVFRAASLIGVRDFYAVGTAFNCLLLTAAAGLTVCTARKLWGDEKAALTLFLWAGALPLYFFAPIFYTDALSLVFPIFLYYGWLKARESEVWPRRVGWLLAAGAACGLGMSIKATVAVAAVAVLIEWLLFGPRLRLLAGIAAGAVAAALVYCGIGAIPYLDGTLDRQRAARQNTPLVHWIMMGLKGNGGYNAEDYAFTRSFADPDERIAADKQVIRERLAEYGFGGYLAFLYQKGVVTLGDGTYQVESFLDDNPCYQTPLHAAAIGTGPANRVFSLVCQGFHLLLLFLYAFGCLWDGLRRAPEERGFRQLVPRLSVFGLLLFLLMWETSPRYLVNFLPLLFLGAAQGAEPLCAGLQQAPAHGARRKRS